jgi:HK97 family phage portal protein
MGILSNLAKRSRIFGANFMNSGSGAATQVHTVQGGDPFWANFVGSSRQNPGFSTELASGLATASACISVVSQSLASVPLSLYRTTGKGGREKATDHPLHTVLHDAPNSQTTAFELREYLVASLMIHGNAFARINWNGRGQVIGMEAIDPRQVSIERLDSGRLKYRIATGAGYEILLQEEVLHIRNRLSAGGVMGISPLFNARATFATALVQQDIANNQAAKSFRPEGVLSLKSKITGANAEVAMSMLQSKIESNASASGVLILDSDASWSPMAFSSKDAEFLESRKLSNLDICRVFGVPPSSAGITDNATYSNSEQEARALVVKCLAPMARRVEMAMANQLLTSESRKTLIIEHDLNGLMRGDMAARFNAYQIARNGGWLNANEIRAFENQSEIEGGDEYWKPMNITTSNTNLPAMA